MKLKLLLTTVFAVGILMLSGIFDVCLGTECLSGDCTGIREIDYHVGDLPIRPNGMAETDTADWKPLTDKARANYTHYKVVWLKVIIPKNHWNLPWLYMNVSDTDYNFFYQGRQVFAERNPNTPNRRWARACSQPIFIPLDSHFNESNFYIRVLPNRFSDTDSWTGMIVGDRTSIMQNISRSNMQSAFLSQIFIFIGFCLIGMVLMGRREFPYFTGIGFFSLCVGLYNFAYLPLFQNVINKPSLSYYGSYLSFYLMPIGIIHFFLIISRPYPDLDRFRTVLKAAFWGFLVHALAMTALDLGGLTAIFSLQKAYGLAFILTTVLMVWMTLKFLKKEKRDTSIIGVGAIFASLGGIHDLLFAITGRYPLGQGISNFGIFIFIISVIVFMFRRFISLHREVQNLNRTLEERIAERTAELQNANIELNVLNEELHAALNNVKEKELQLIQSEKMALLGNLVAGIAHEINSPLGSIKSNVEMESLLLQSAEAEQAGAGCTEVLEQAASMNKVNKLALDRIVSLVKNLKNFARLDEAEMKEADLHEGIDSTLMILNNQLKTRIEIIRDYGPIPQVYCHPQQLNQVFLNILLNAIQAIEGKGTITIRTSFEDGIVRIGFKDTGHGIPPEILPKIFKAGFTTKPSNIGTGLGLSICEELIQKNRGRIRVESEPGNGAEFIIELPAVKGT